jgi:competence protein ComEA
MASWLQQYRTTIVVVAAAVAVIVLAYIVQRTTGPQPLQINVADLTATAGGPIEVYITGAVARPGVYEMADADRVVDLLYEAGGRAPDANLEAINLAKRLHDEDMVVVPRFGEPVSGVAGVVSATAMNINTEPADMLATLPGIGEVYSGRIAESRTRDGLFATTKELVDRKLIPRATYDRIRELITVGP